MRSVITATFLILYVASTNIWIYLLSSNQLTIKQNRLSAYIINGLMICFCFWDIKNITDTTFHVDFNNVAFSALISNFILNIANHSGLINADMPSMFLIFNGLIFVITVSLLISSWQHGYFKNKYEND